MNIINKNKLLEQVNRYTQKKELNTGIVRRLEKTGTYPYGVSLNTIYSLKNNRPVSKQSVIQLCYKCNIKFLEHGKDIQIL